MDQFNNINQRIALSVPTISSCRCIALFWPHTGECLQHKNCVLNHDIMTSWHHDIMTSWHYDIMTLWHHDIMGIMTHDIHFEKNALNVTSNANSVNYFYPYRKEELFTRMNFVQHFLSSFNLPLCFRISLVVVKLFVL